MSLFINKTEIKMGKNFFLSLALMFILAVSPAYAQSKVAITDKAQFLTGEIENVHDVMIAVEKAGISFEMLMEIRNKMIEAYHELMRMQV